MPLILLRIPTKFQFHKGTIRTNVGQAANANVPQFQFHKGTIRT